MPCGGCAAGRIFFERKSALREGNRHAGVCRGAQCAPLQKWEKGGLKENRLCFWGKNKIRISKIERYMDKNLQRKIQKRKDKPTFFQRKNGKLPTLCFTIRIF